MWSFSPTLALPSRRLALPRPVVQLRVQDAHEAARFQVPARDGSLWAGRSRGGVDISIRGQFGRSGDGLTLTEPAMLDAIDAVRSALRLADPEAVYGLGLFVFVDPDDPAAPSPPLRGFMQCSTVRFEYDLSDRAMYGYSLMVHASDPDLHVGDLIDIRPEAPRQPT